MRSTPRLFLAALALISTTAFVSAQDSAAPSNAAATTAQTKSVEPLLPSALPAAVETRTGEVESPNKTGKGGWFLLGLVAVALFTNITRYRSRLPKRNPVPVANLPLEPQPAPVRLP